MAKEGSNDKGMNSNPDKDYGLPKVEIKPIQETQNLPDAADIPLKSKEEVSETKPVLPKAVEERTVVEKEKPVSNKEEKKRNYSWLILLLLLLVAGAGGWFYYSNTINPPDSNSNSSPAKKDAEVQNGPQQEPRQPLTPVPQPPVEEEVEESAKEITLTEIKSRAGAPRYFVVVGSFVDEDMAKDYSKMLHEKEMSTFLVYPYDQIAYYRLAIGKFESFDLASKEIDRVKEGFKEDLWVLKY
jgi:hypothetical protein